MKPPSSFPYGPSGQDLFACATLAARGGWHFSSQWRGTSVREEPRSRGNEWPLGRELTVTAIHPLGLMLVFLLTDKFMFSVYVC